MKRALRMAAVVAALAPAAALACGGFYAQGVQVSSDQKIVVTHRAGVETYTFRPHFCGTAKDFGVILPIPSTLSSPPALAENALFEQLDRHTEPAVVEACEQSGIGCGAAAKGGAGLGDGFDAGNPVNVVDRGRVGIFDYVLLQATTAAAFTDWLDANGFPRGPAGVDPYSSYVAKGWYFVAFKVTADANAPAAGQKLCGDLGPITLSFASARPVVPARIASVNAVAGTWRLFVIASTEQGLDAASRQSLSATRYFSGALRQADLSSAPELAAASRDGERLTVLDVRLDSSAVDIGLEDTAASDFRGTKTVYKNCGGCAAGQDMPVMVFAMLAALALLRRRHTSPCGSGERSARSAG